MQTCDQAADDDCCIDGAPAFLRHCSTYTAAATGSETHHAASASAGISQLMCVQEVKGLAMVLERTPYPLAIELAALASQRGILSLQPWLQVLI